MACRVVTVAGTIEEGYSDGPGHEARFKNPLEMTLTADGSLLVADYGNHCIRQIDQYGIVSGYAGCPGKTGRTDGPKSSALFNGPMGLCITRDGSVIVGDSGSNVIRKISTSGIVSTLITSPTASSKRASAYSSYRSSDCSTASRCSSIRVCTNLSNGNSSNDDGDGDRNDDDNEFLYVCHGLNLLKFDLSTGCNISTVLMSPQTSPVSSGASTRIQSTTCATSMERTSLFVAERSGGRVLMVTGDNKSTTMAASSWEDLDKSVVKVLGDGLSGVAVDDYGYMYISNLNVNYIATISPRLAGGVLAGQDKLGISDGIATNALFGKISRLFYDSDSHCLYVSQRHSIRKVILPMRPLAPEQQRILQRVRKVTDEGIGTDVVFHVDGDTRKIYAVTSLLCANSEYFKAMFNSSMKESTVAETKQPIVVKSTSYEAFRAVITWVMYGVEIVRPETSSKIVSDALRLADSYLLAKMKKTCAALLMRSIDDTNVFEIMALAEATNVIFLKAECITFVVKNLTEMRKRPEFRQLSPEIVMTIVQQVKVD